VSRSKRPQVIDQNPKFAQVPHLVIDGVKNANALAVYVLLKRFASWDTGFARPERRTLAMAMGYKDAKVVDRALAVLQELRLVEVFPRFWDGQNIDAWVVERDEDHPLQTSNGYVLLDVMQSALVTPYPAEGIPLPSGGHTPYPLQEPPPTLQREANNNQGTRPIEQRGGLRQATNSLAAPGDVLPPRCKKHEGIKGWVEEKCPECETLRLAAQKLEAQRKADEDEVRRQRMKREALERLLAIQDCYLCDEDGRIGKQVCRHEDPPDLSKMEGRKAAWKALGVPPPEERDA